MSKKNKIISSLLFIGPIMIVLICFFVNTAFIGSRTIGSPYFKTCLEPITCVDGDCGYVQKLEAPLYCSISKLVDRQSSYFFSVGGIILGLILGFIFLEWVERKSAVLMGAQIPPSQASNFGILSGLFLSVLAMCLSFYIGTLNPYNFFAIYFIIFYFLAINSFFWFIFRKNKTLIWGVKLGYFIAPIVLWVPLVSIFG